jgi:hypothetical protein
MEAECALALISGRFGEEKNQWYLSEIFIFRSARKFVSVVTEIRLQFVDK